jgi:hypothetical protein
MKWNLFNRPCLLFLILLIVCLSTSCSHVKIAATAMSGATPDEIADVVVKEMGGESIENVPHELIKKSKFIEVYVFSMETSIAKNVPGDINWIETLGHSFLFGPIILFSPKRERSDPIFEQNLNQLSLNFNPKLEENLIAGLKRGLEFFEGASINLNIIPLKDLYEGKRFHFNDADLHLNIGVLFHMLTEGPTGWSEPKIQLNSSVAVTIIKDKKTQEFLFDKRVEWKKRENKGYFEMMGGLNQDLEKTVFKGMYLRQFTLRSGWYKKQNWLKDDGKILESELERAIYFFNQSVFKLFNRINKK